MKKGSKFFIIMAFVVGAAIGALVTWSIMDVKAVKVQTEVTE